MNKIDDLFKEAMTGYQVQPSPGLWLRIERRFFPPSRFRPSGLITSVLLLTVAGLMPWILIPANDQSRNQPDLPSGKTRTGYLIKSATPGELADFTRSGASVTGRAFAIHPSLILSDKDDPASSAGSQLLASIIDPASDPAIQPLLKAYRLEYEQTLEKEPAATAYSALHYVYRMRSLSAGPLNQNLFGETISEDGSNIPGSSFTSRYENDYFQTGEFSAGLNFNPSIIFYDPNPYNKILGGEAVFQYKLRSFSIMSGLGFSRAEDIGSYKVNYISNDSVGYYLRVVSFIPDPRNPGNVTYILVRETIYDSVPHYAMEDKTNRYSYIDIPLSFGYSFYSRNRITLTASAGVKFSFLVGRDEPRVDFLQSDAELIDIERQVPPRTNTNWRFTAGVDFGYLFTRNFSLHLEPVFEQYISPIYVSQTGYLPKKPYILGIKAGIRYNF